MFYEELFGV